MSCRTATTHGPTPQYPKLLKMSSDSDKNSLLYFFFLAKSSLDWVLICELEHTLLVTIIIKTLFSFIISNKVVLLQLTFLSCEMLDVHNVDQCHQTPSNFVLLNKLTLRQWTVREGLKTL